MFSLHWHSPAAYITSLKSSGSGSLTQGHLVQFFNSFTYLSKAVSIEEVLTSHIYQKVLSNKTGSHLFNLLFENSSPGPADRARLRLVSTPHAASWVSYEGLGLHLQSFRVLGGGQHRSLCPESVLDHLHVAWW